MSNNVDVAWILGMGLNLESRFVLILTFVQHKYLLMRQSEY